MRATSLSIRARIILLVAGAVLLALAAMMLMTFRGPPPHARPLSPTDAAHMLAGNARPSADWTIERRHARTLPVASDGLHPDRSAAAAIARLLAIPAADVHLLRAGPPAPDAEMHDRFTLARRDATGWMIIEARQATRWSWFAVTLSLMAAIFALLLLPASRVAAHIARPITLLAERAARGRPEQADPLPILGPPEVRRVGESFNQMRGRLADHLAERTAMLVAIAHDLRTPMTRLSFRLEHLPDGVREKAQADVQDMRTMVTDLLDFVRGTTEDDHGAMIRVDLSAIVQTLADDMTDMGQGVTVTSGGTRAVVQGDAVALRRCIGNLVDNALRYAGSARITLSITSVQVEIRVEDDGPGVPPAIIDRLCEPFYRGEASRNRATGGVGLGLSIARRIAQAHGGALHVANRAPHGLAVMLILPIDG